MSVVGWLVWVVSLGLALWWGRRIPLAGWRKRFAIGCRVAALGALCAALWGPPRRFHQELTRRVIYLVDRSASIDPAQRAWMTQRIASLESLRPPQLERALIAFGADARIVMPFGREPLTDPATITHALENSGVQGDQTNLEAALLVTLGLLPPGALAVAPSHAGAAGPAGLTGVVLLSDGRETVGDVMGIAAAVRRIGLQVFPAPTPISGEARTLWEKLAVAPVVQRGSSVPIELVMFNGSSRVKPAQVTIALRGVPIKRQRIAVRPGWQVFKLAVPAIQRGTMALDVHVELPQDGLSEHRRAYTEVEGPPQLLLVSDRLATLPALATSLKRREIEIATARPQDLSSEADQLLDADAVMLFNLPKSALSAAQVEALRGYVEQFGGGLIMVGLGGDLASEISTPAPLDPLLPVTFEPKGLQEAKRRVCMILLVDRSASMYGPRIAATKRAAVEFVKQLSPEDLVGVLAFDTQPYVVAEVQPVGRLSSVLVEKLVKLRATGGTDVYPALTAAASRLDQTGATLKHIILLSDGNTPFQRPAYEALIKSFHVSGITVSTIGIGAAFINTDYLDYLATSTGGTFYQMRTLEELPKLVARDTQQALGRLPFTEGYFRPSKSPTTDWFSQTADWPPLRGYLTATARAAAQVDLAVDGGSGDDPLLARWSVGRGRVVSFTSDADTRWSPEWIRWPGFEAAWAQVVRWAMRPRLTEELFVWMDDSRGMPRLVLEGALDDPRGELIAEPGAAAIPLSLVQTGNWRWQASLEQVPSGWYQLVLESHLPIPSRNDEGPPRSSPVTGAGSTVVVKRWVQVGTPPTSNETVGQPPHEALLRQVAHATAGVYDVPDRAFLPPSTTAPVEMPALAWWLPLAIVALLVDIALRGSSML
ncbi:MAG: VWA domain-containing protein [Candidatus Omnitrophica bacterium]|nr:VWA domain-containing protein [Candidatus Omnitrophota bacterium]